MRSQGASGKEGWEEDARPARRPAAAVARREPSPLSPRFARLVRESWWLVIVAGLVWLALILATYTRTDRAWSFSGTGAPIGNKGGVAGAWLSDLLLYLFGLSAWWLVAAGIVIIVAASRRIGEPDRESAHPLLYGSIGFVLVLLSSSAIEAIRLWRLPAALPDAPGGAVGDLIGVGLARALGFNGATLLLLAAFAVGFSLFTGVSWLRLMERIGVAVERALAWARAKREEASDRRIGEQSLAEREAVVERSREDEEDREPIVVVPGGGGIGEGLAASAAGAAAAGTSSASLEQPASVKASAANVTVSAVLNRVISGRLR